MKMIYCNKSDDSYLSHINAKFPTERYFNPRLNKDIEKLVRYNKQVFNHQIMNSKVIPTFPEYQTSLFEK